MRRPILAANWKMQMGVAEAIAYADRFLGLIAEPTAVDVILAPPATALDALGQRLAQSPVALAAQNVHPAAGGAFTGELSAGMLSEVGCRYAIVGHSERRTLLGETSEFVGAKARALLEAGITPIVCCGETDDERESGRTFDVISEQLEISLGEIPADRGADLVVAYEPIWAIGTGKTATPETAQEVHAMIRERLRDRFGDAAAEIRIQYGGSVKPDNVAALMSQTDIDGALVGGASLDPESFAEIVRLSVIPTGDPQ